ncbi:MAG: hypothetical protein AB8G14_15025 [Ilumatobacter sp.]
MTNDAMTNDANTGDATTDSVASRHTGAVMNVAPAPSDPPPGFVRDQYEHVWTVDRSRSDVWTWLCDPATFTDGQIPPFRVEFLNNAAGRTGFEEGVYNAHVGPLMAFSGVLGEIDAERYRDLQYFYGSYAISHGLFRPVRLQFWLEDGPAQNTTVLRLQLDTFVRERALGAWHKLMGVFWKRFGRWCEKAIPNNWLR